MLATIASGCARATLLDRGDAAPVPDGSVTIDGRAVDALHLAPDATADAGCAVSAGTTVALDGNADLAKFPAAARLALGASMTIGSDAAAITWDRTRLYVAVTSDAFVGAYEPLHVYLQLAPLDVAVPSVGKEYGGLVAALPFLASHLVAARRVTDSGTGAYDGVFRPASSWTMRETPLAPGADVFASQDQRTLSVEVAWSALGGCPTSARLAVHVVHAATGNEWKDLAPATHTPWLAPGGGYYEIDLTADPATASWTLR